MMERLLRAVSRLLPRTLRERFPELTDSLVAAWRAGRRDRGLLGRMALAVHLVGDVLFQASRVRARRFLLSPPGADSVMSGLLIDVRHALFAVRRQPGLVLAVVLMLGLAIGGATISYSVLYAETLRPLPYAQAERLVVITHAGFGNLSPPNVEDLRRTIPAFEAVTGFDDRKVFNVTGVGEPLRVYGAAVDPRFFSVLRVQPVLGRLLGAADDRPDGPPVVVISERLWRRALGAEPDVVGREIILDDVAHTVVGVVPGAFSIPDAEEIWIPQAIYPYGDDRRTDRAAQYLEVMARLDPRADLETARLQIRGMSERLASDYPDANDGLDLQIRTLREQVSGSVEPTLRMLSYATGGVLLIACVNVANLLMARASRRSGELGLRSALGASRSRLVRQSLIESTTLAILATGFGLSLAMVGTRAIASALASELPIFARVGLEPWAVMMAVSLSLTTTVLFASVSALRGTAPDPVEALREIRTRGVVGARLPLRQVFIVAQLAILLTLLVGTGLVIRSLVGLTAVDPGFRATGVVTAQLALPESRYDESGASRFWERLLESVRLQPGVDAAGLTSRLPVSGGTSTTTFSIQARDPGEEPTAHVRVVSPGYFEAMRIPITRGRGLAPHDSRSSEPVVLIDETLARSHWEDSPVMGDRIRLGEGRPWRRIVGVVAATRHWGRAFDPTPTLYVPLEQRPQTAMMVAVHAASSVGRVADGLRSAVSALDPAIPVHALRPMSEYLAAATMQPRTRTWVLTTLAVLALVLATVGLYGVVSYDVSRRTREVGVRMALGAGSRSVMGLVLGTGLRLACAGIVLGLAGAWLATRSLETMLFGVTPLDPISLGAAAAVVLVTTLAAAWIPGRRASRVDPVRSLQAD